jgi:hypothetical protein
MKQTTANIIKAITKYLPVGQSHHIYLDKFYMNHNLMVCMLNDGHDFTEAGKENNFKQMFINKLGEAKQNESGQASLHRKHTIPDSTTKVVSGIAIHFNKRDSSGKEKKSVHAFFSSTLSGSKMGDKVDMVADYSKNSRTVDIVDQILRSVELPHKLSRFTQPILYFLMQAMALNAWSMRTQLGYKHGRSFIDALEKLANEISLSKTNASEYR